MLDANGYLVVERDFNEADNIHTFIVQDVDGGGRYIVTLAGTD